MRSLTLILPIAVLVAAIVIFYSQFFSTPAGSDSDDLNAPSTSSSAASDFGVVPDASSESAELANESSKDESQLSNNSPAQVVTNTAQSSQDYPETYGYEIANGRLSDEEFNALVARLRNDPFLLNELLNELRAETDPARIKRLAALLGETRSADVLAIAEELAYSSVPATQAAGLDILSRIAPDNPEAYDIAVSILSSSAEPAVLVSSMNVLASPRNIGRETRMNAITQTMPLAEHESAAVRRLSVSLLPRLTRDDALAPILYNALSDSDAKVRSSATFAIANFPDESPEVIERLLELAENPNETDGLRRGAIYALQQKTPTAETSARISKAKIQMREAALAAQ